MRACNSPVLKPLNISIRRAGKMNVPNIFFPFLGWGLVWNIGDKKEKNCGHKKEKVWNIDDKKEKL